MNPHPNSPIATAAAIRRVERQLHRYPFDVQARNEYGRLLIRLGKDKLAQDAFVRVLHQDPNNVSALLSLGWLAQKTSSPAAIKCFGRAMTIDPNNVRAMVGLANALLERSDLNGARELYESALRLDRYFLPARQGLARLHVKEDNWPPRWYSAFAQNHVRSYPYRGTRTKVPRVLLLKSTLGGNTPTRAMLTDQFFDLHEVYVEFFGPREALPDHDIIFNAVGDADLRGEALHAARAIVRRSGKPVINSPGLIIATRRLNNYHRMAKVPGVIAPRAAMISRRALLGRRAMVHLAKAKLSFPFLLRTPGFHGGKHLALVSNPRELRSTVQTLLGPKLLAIQFLDTKGLDGNVRKYRVIIVDGKLYPAGLSISRNWNAHHTNSLVLKEGKLRDEEAQFLGQMSTVLKHPTRAALGRIRDILKLDFGGIDFGVDADGAVQFFEGNATMALGETNRGDRWDYRRISVDRIATAVRRMLGRRTKTGLRE